MKIVIVALISTIILLPYYFRISNILREEYVKLDFKTGSELTNGTIKKEGVHTLFSNCYLDGYDNCYQVLVIFKPLVYIILLIPLFIIGIIIAAWECGIKNFKPYDYIMFETQVEHENLEKAEKIWKENKEE